MALAASGFHHRCWQPADRDSLRPRPERFERRIPRQRLLLASGSNSECPLGRRGHPEARPGNRAENARRVRDMAKILFGTSFYQPSPFANINLCQCPYGFSSSGNRANRDKRHNRSRRAGRSAPHCPNRGYTAGNGCCAMDAGRTLRCKDCPPLSKCPNRGSTRRNSAPAGCGPPFTTLAAHCCALQRADGHWVGELQGDTILESEFILLLAFLGRERDDRVRRCRELHPQPATAGRRLVELPRRPAGCQRLGQGVLRPEDRRPLPPTSRYMRRAAR